MGRRKEMCKMGYIVCSFVFFVVGFTICSILNEENSQKK